MASLDSGQKEKTVPIKRKSKLNLATELQRLKTSFTPGPTQTGLCSHKKGLEASNFGFKKTRDGTIQAVKTKELNRCAVTAQLTCVFVFA